MEFGWPMRHHVPGAVSASAMAIDIINDRTISSVRATRFMWSPGLRDGTEGAVNLRVIYASLASECGQRWTWLL